MNWEVLEHGRDAATEAQAAILAIEATDAKRQSLDATYNGLRRLSLACLNCWSRLKVTRSLDGVKEIEMVEEFFKEIEPFEVESNVYGFAEGVMIGLRPSRVGDAVYVMKIVSQDRGEGQASYVLDAICEMADRHSVVLFLEVEVGDGLTRGQLAEWYWRKGFRGDFTEMIREPRNRTAD